ncbi:MAG: hypothetical protein PVSMB7_27420 [Chloroflexota bacterium]
MRRVGLIGFGSIAENGHLPAWHAFPHCRVVAVADLSAERRARAREVLPDAAIFESPADLIERAEVDTVDICTPPGTHVELLTAACARGIADIVSEKPFVLTRQEFNAVARARAESGSRVISVNNWLYSDLYGALHRVLQEHSIGRFRHILLRTGRPDNAKGNDGWLPQWRTDPAHSGGGILLDHGWHQLYLLLGWLGTDVREISATTRIADPRHAPVEDEATVELRFADAIGRIELSWTANDRTNDGLVRGEHGEVEILDGGIVVRNRDGEREYPFNSRLTASSYHSDWFEEMFRYNVFDHSRDEADRNFREAGILVEIIGAAYRSAQLGGTAQAPTLPTEVMTGVS